MKQNYFLLLILLLSNQLVAQYKLTGRINLHKEYGNTLYLASINSLDELYSASPDYIINKTRVDSLGYFEMSGSDLSDEDRIFRLYLSRKNTDTYLFRGGTDENFIHLVINNSSNITILSSANGPRVFEAYEIKGSHKSEEVGNFYKLLDHLHKISKSEINSDAKQKLIDAKFNSAIIKFAEETPYPLVSLVAISHIEPSNITKESYKKLESIFNSLENKNSISYYKTSFESKLKDFDKPFVEKQQKTNRGLTIILFILLAASLLLNLYLLFLLKHKNKDSKMLKKLATISEKETQVLQLLWQGKSNKEIAMKLHIEVSTVKSHIQHIYKKLKINSRKEVYSFKKLSLP